MSTAGGFPWGWDINHIGTPSEGQYPGILEVISWLPINATFDIVNSYST